MELLLKNGALYLNSLCKKAGAALEPKEEQGGAEEINEKKLFKGKVDFQKK